MRFLKQFLYTSLIKIGNGKCNEIFLFTDFDENECFSKSENSRLIEKSMLSLQKIVTFLNSGHIVGSSFSLAFINNLIKQRETPDTFKYQRKLALTDF